MNTISKNDKTATDAYTMLADAVCRPNLFSTEMVKAILKGDKIQTRRIAKWNKKITDAKVGFTAFCDVGEYAVRGVHENGEYGESIFKTPCKKGDVLWVRETFEPVPIENTPIDENTSDVIFKYRYKANGDLPFNKWKPSLFMPKDACRLFLEVTKVRIEKLQNISERDCREEGIRIVQCFESKKTGFLNPKRTDNAIFKTGLKAFENLWNSINGKQSWEENPYVFVYNFKVISRPYGFC